MMSLNQNEPLSADMGDLAIQKMCVPNKLYLGDIFLVVEFV
jgi:hypothetical protein